MFPVLFLLARPFKISDASFALIALFIILHLVGSHYTYEQVPFGYTLGNWLGTDRNMYDRLVHFSFGFLVVLPLREILLNSGVLRKVWSHTLSVGVVLAGAAWYEMFEWITTKFVSLSISTPFLSSQGDVWDPQKDMAMATLGAILMTAIVIFFRHRQISRSKRHQ
jgi:putative membrane protein